MSRLLHQIADSNADSRPDSAAVVFGDTTISYGELIEKTAQIAGGLVKLGVQKSDRIGIYMPKNEEIVPLILGSTQAGGIFVPINPLLKAQQVEHIVNDCQISVLVTTANRYRALAAALRDNTKCRTIVIVGSESADSAPEFSVLGWDELLDSPPVDGPALIDKDVAAIFYTSGSTGKPKGVVLSHGNLVEGAESVNGYLHNRPSDRILSVLPLSFDAGFSQMTLSLDAGSSLILLNYFLANDVQKAITESEITAVTGVPPLWNQLAQLDWSNGSGDSIRYFANTGGKMPKATLDSLRRHFSNAKPYLMYGLTEAFRSTYLPPEEVDKRPDSIGKAIPNAEIVVVNPQGERCRPGEPGELVHRGCLVSLGYWNNPEMTAERYRPMPGSMKELPLEEMAVWSGDTVQMDEEGFLYFVGRKDDMIKTSGYRVSPTEVEETVYASGSVMEAAAIGVPHSKLGQAILIVATSQDGAEGDTQAVLTHCKRVLPNYMVPTAVEWVDEIERSPNGKMNRKLLLAKYENKFEGA